MKVKSTHSTPRSDPSTKLRTGARGMPFGKLKAPSTAEGLRVDTERRFFPRSKNQGLARSNISRGETGASAVEFAIVLPILVLLIFGIIEFSVALYDKTMITNASREGARAGIVFRVPSVTDGEIISVVDNYLGSSLITFGTPVAANTTVARTGYNPGDQLTVTVNYTYTFLIIPSFVASLGGGINMVAQTVMRME